MHGKYCLGGLDKKWGEWFKGEKWENDTVHLILQTQQIFKRPGPPD
jgi:hypothetical protein